MQIIKYTFDVHGVAMVSHIPVKSRMAVNYVSGACTIPIFLRISSPAYHFVISFMV